MYKYNQTFLINKNDYFFLLKLEKLNSVRLVTSCRDIYSR